MKQFQTIAIMVLAVVIVIMYITRPSGHDQRIKDLDNQIELLMKVNKKQAEFLKESAVREGVLRADYEASEARRIEAGKNTDKWRKRYESEKNKPVHLYNDVQLDSILTAWYGR